MNYRKLSAALVAAVFVGGLTLGGASIASATQPDFICNEAGFEAKVDTTGDPATVEVTAPEGKLIDAYCVKAGPEKYIVPVDPPAATAIIDHPVKDSVSHYQVHLIDAPVVLTKVTATAPSATPPTCDAAGSLVIPTTTGVVYTGGPSTGPGTYLVTAAAAEGYELEGQSEWSIDVLDQLAEDSDECYTPPVTPEPRICVPAGDWYTEGDDVAPSLSPEGLVFTGGSGDAVGVRVPVTGNLQGWSALEYTATGATDVFYVRIVIDSSADGGHPYSSLTVTSGSPVTASSVAYSNKLDTSKTLAEWAAFYPNAVITSVGFHLDSAASADDEVILSSVTGPCATVDFTSDQPADIVTVVTDEDVDCEADEVTTTTTTTTVPSVWVEGEWVAGKPVITTDVTTRDATEEECPAVVTPPTQKPTPAPAANTTPASSELAETGFDMGGVYLYAALSTLVLGTALVGLSAVALKRRKAQQ